MRALYRKTAYLQVFLHAVRSPGYAHAVARPAQPAPPAPGPRVRVAGPAARGCCSLNHEQERLCGTSFRRASSLVTSRFVGGNEVALHVGEHGVGPLREDVIRHNLDPVK